LENPSATGGLKDLVNLDRFRNAVNRSVDADADDAWFEVLQVLSLHVGGNAKQESDFRLVISLEGCDVDQGRRHFDELRRPS
jgi:hypothetical protein